MKRSHRARCLRDPSHHFSTGLDTLTSAIGHPCRFRRPADLVAHTGPLRFVSKCDVLSGPKWPQDGSCSSIVQGFSLLHFQRFSTVLHNPYAQHYVQLTQFRCRTRPIAFSMLWKGHAAASMMSNGAAKTAARTRCRRVGERAFAMEIPAEVLRNRAPLAPLHRREEKMRATPLS